MGFRMLLGREDDERKSASRSEQNIFGTASTDTLKELYKNSEKASSGLRIGLLASNQIVQQQAHHGSRNAWSEMHF
jgi:ribosomal protein S6--L-glutamate ligase